MHSLLAKQMFDAITLFQWWNMLNSFLIPNASNVLLIRLVLIFTIILIPSMAAAASCAVCIFDSGTQLNWIFESLYSIRIVPTTWKWSQFAYIASFSFFTDFEREKKRSEKPTQCCTAVKFSTRFKLVQFIHTHALARTDWGKKFFLNTFRCCCYFLSLALKS